MRAAEEAKALFDWLTSRKSVTHRSEGHYGRACIYATLGIHWDARQELVTATRLNPLMPERACWDSDFAKIRGEVYGGNAVPVWDNEFEWFVMDESIHSQDQQ